MKKITVSSDQNKWSIMGMTKLVHKIGKSKCGIDIVSNRRYINMKSISSVIDFGEKVHRKKKVEIWIDGEDEDEVSSLLQEYFQN